MRGTVTLVFLLGAAVTGFGVGLPVVAIAPEYEVWVIDQSDTTPGRPATPPTLRHRGFSPFCPSFPRGDTR